MVETRLQERSRMAEERFQAIEQRLQTMDNTLQGLLARVNTGLANLQQEMQEMQEFRAAGQHGPRNHDHYQERYQDCWLGHPQYRKPIQFTKMDFPRYSGDDILTWLLKCERFFELDDTPEESKVKMASLNLDDKTFQWHRALERRLRNQLPSWDEYAVILQDNFGPAFENPMSDLTHLQQTGSLVDYNAEFDYIAAKLDITEDYLVGVYVSALKPELAGLVQMFSPRTLTEARRLAKMQEIIVDNLNSQIPGEKSGRNVSISTPGPSLNHPETLPPSTKLEFTQRSERHICLVQMLQPLPENTKGCLTKLAENPTPPEIQKSLGRFGESFDEPNRPMTLYHKWAFQLHYSPPRSLVISWFKGKLVKMLQGSSLVQGSVYLV